MSIGLDCFIEVKKNGKWEEHKFVHREPLAYDYAIFSYDAITFLTGFNNKSGEPTIGGDKFYRGYPNDSDWLNEVVRDSAYGIETKLDTIINNNNYAISYVSLKELLLFNYEQEFEDDITGEKVKYKDHLNKSFFDALDYLKELDDEPQNIRIIYNLS